MHISLGQKLLNEEEEKFQHQKQASSEIPKQGKKIQKQVSQTEKKRKNV
jgi:hypothetical protein